MKTIILLFSILLSLFIFQSRENGGKRHKHLGELKQNNGTYLGSVYGVKNLKGLYSKLIIINDKSKQRDTLYLIDSIGFHNQKGLEMLDSNQDFDGWNIEILKSSGIDVWSEKINGPVSAGLLIEWVDSVKLFQIQYAP